MFDGKLADRIEKLLANHQNREFKSGDIARELHLKKHKRRDLEDTLRKLRRNQRIAGKNKRYYAVTSSPSQEYTGKFDARPLAQNKSFAFVIQEGKDIYVSREDILNAYHGDTVTIAIKYEGKDSLHGYITGIKERARQNIAGKLELYKGKYYLIPDNSIIHTDFMVYDKGDARPGEKVVCQITNWGDSARRILPSGKVTRVLGIAGDPDVEILAVICNFDLPLEFPDEVIEETEKLPTEISEIEIQNRSDLRNLHTITIDPASAKDYDDAISLNKTPKGYELYVHIADVSHYVKPGSALFDEAKKRGNSYYFPRKVIPMLPEKISNGICSLRPKEDKLTVTVLTEYDRHGTIIYQKATESVICSDERLAYEQVDRYIEGNDHDLEKETQILIDNMRELSALLQKKRLDRGYLSLDLPETEYVFDDNGHVIDLKRSMETESHQIIENFMLAANEFVAKTLSEGNTLYRVHEAPDPDSIEDLQRLANVHKFNFDLSHPINKAFQIALDSLETPDRHRVFDRIILRHLQKAKYDTINRGHFGLALSNYTHFTSPIRRLCDLVVHIQLKASLIDQSAKPFSKPQLDDFAKSATEKEIVADNSERDVDMKNKLLFMKKKVGEKFDGIVIAIKASSIIIEIDKYPVTGIVPLSSLNDDYYEYHAYYDTLLGTHKAKAIRLGDRFQVQLVRVEDDIVFQVLDY